MADRTPRIAYVNQLYDPGVTLSASSADLPVRGKFCVLDPTPTRKWRSKLGWNVVQDFNDRVYFLEDANARVGSLALGNQAAGNTQALVLQTALNTAPGHVNTYTVTYDPGTFKYTITRVSGTAVLTLDVSNANQRSCHVDFGWNTGPVNPSGTTLTGNKAAYKSREWLQIGPSAWTKRHAILYGSNCPSGLAFFQISPDGTTWNNVEPAAGEGIMTGTTGRILTSDEDDDSYSYGRFFFNDVSNNTLGYSDAGIIFFGDTLELSRGVRQGWTQQQGQLTSYAVGDTGSVFVDLKPSPRSWSVEFARLRKSDRDALVAFSNAVVLGGSFFFEFDPQNDLTDTYYVFLTQGLQFTQRVGDGDPPDRFDVGQFDMQEHL